MDLTPTGLSVPREALPIRVPSTRAIGLHSYTRSIDCVVNPGTVILSKLTLLFVSVHAPLSIAAMFLPSVVLVLGFVGAVFAGDAVQLDSLVDQCKFTIDGNSYDLCPLLKQNSWALRYERQTPPSITTGRYWIKVDGKLPKNESLPAGRQVSV